MTSPKSAPSARAPLDRVASFAEVRRLWTTSSGLGDERGVFATWEWCDAWWAHYGGSSELLLHVDRSGAGAARVILPCYERRVGPLRVVRFVGHGPGDELGPLYARGDASRAAGALLALLEGRRWNVLVAEQLPGQDGWPGRLGGRPWRRESNRVVDLAHGWDAYLDGCSPNLRQQIRARRRRLDRAGVVITATDGESLERDFDTLVALHARVWGSRSDFSPHLAFHRAFARLALERGWLRLWIARLDDMPIAAWYGFHVGTTVTYYQAGRDPSHDRLAPGFVLMAHALEASIASGASRLRLGRGDEPFKQRFAPVDAGLDTTILANGVVGAGAVATARAVRRARRRLRDVRNARR